MFFRDLIVKISRETNVKTKDVNAVLRCYSDIIKNNIMGDDITLPGVGKFTKKLRAGRIYRNPRTGEEIERSDNFIPSFKMYSNTVKELGYDR